MEDLEHIGMRAGADPNMKVRGRGGQQRTTPIRSELSRELSREQGNLPARGRRASLTGPPRPPRPAQAAQGRKKGKKDKTFVG